MEDYNVNVDHAKHSIGGGFRTRDTKNYPRIDGGHTIIVLFLWQHYSSVPLPEPTRICQSCMPIHNIGRGNKVEDGVVVIGQREYESNQISALAWGTLSVSIALLISPTMGNTGFKAGLFGTPIIFGLCIVDPVMGEVKRRTEGLRTAIVFGLLASYVVWFGCWHLIGTPLLASVLLAPDGCR